MEAIGRASWQGAAAVVLVWAVCRLLPKLPGGIQCWLWRLVCVKLLLTLFWTVPIDLPLLSPERASGAGPAIGTADPSATSTWTRVAPPGARRFPGPFTAPWGTLLVLWLTGSAACCVRVARQRGSARRLLR